MACWPCAGSVEPNAPRRRPAQEAAMTPREAFALPRIEEADLGRQPFPFRERAGVRGVPGIQLSLTAFPLPLEEGARSLSPSGRGQGGGAFLAFRSPPPPPPPPPGGGGRPAAARGEHRE